MLENSASRFTDMNVFGGSQIGEKNKIISQLEQSIKLNSSKLVRFQNLLEENIKNVQVHEEQIKTEHSAREDVLSDFTKLSNLFEQNTKSVQVVEQQIQTLHSVWGDIKDMAIEMKTLQNLLEENIKSVRVLEEKTKSVRGMRR